MRCLCVICVLFACCLRVVCVLFVCCLHRICFCASTYMFVCCVRALIQPSGLCGDREDSGVELNRLCGDSLSLSIVC